MLLMWPTVAVLGFLALTAVVIALGVSSTARYEFDRNRAERQESRADVRATGRHPAGSRLGRRGPVTDGSGSPAASPSGGDVVQAAVGLAPAAPAVEIPVRAEVPVPVEVAPAVGWWLLHQPEEAASPENRPQVIGGPFPDRLEGEWAALNSGLPGSATVVLHGVRCGDELPVPRPSAQELAWLAELGGQLDRLGEDWDTLVSDDDELTTLVVEVTAALVDAGLQLADDAGTAADPGATPAGGASLTPAPGLGALVVSWRCHDRMSVEQVRGAAADAVVRQAMNVALADVLETAGFLVEPFGDTGCHLVAVPAD